MKYTPITSGQTKQETGVTSKHFYWNIPDGNGKIFCMPGSPLVKDMQKITIGYDGRVKSIGSFSLQDREEQAEWVKWNLELDNLFK